MSISAADEQNNSYEADESELWEGAICSNCICDCHCADTERVYANKEKIFIDKGECHECFTADTTCSSCEH